jgi:hypothetical protein
MKNPAAISLLLLFLLPALCGCTPQASAGKELDDKTFVDVYVALLEQSSLPDSARADAAASRDRTHVFAGLGITEDAFRKYIDSYRSDPQQWRIILEEVVKRLEARMRKPEQTSPR